MNLSMHPTGNYSFMTALLHNADRSPVLAVFVIRSERLSSYSKPSARVFEWTYCVFIYRAPAYSLCAAGANTAHEMQCLLVLGITQMVK